MLLFGMAVGVIVGGFFVAYNPWAAFAIRMLVSKWTKTEKAKK